MEWPANREAGGDFWRIGDKLVSRQKLIGHIERMFALRASGLSQQDVAQVMGVDRTLVSRLESLGEVRKGSRVAVIGFPVANKEELEAVAAREGVEFTLLMTDGERWRYVQETSGPQLFNQIMEVLSRVKDFDSVIFLGSDMRIRLMEAILGSDRVVGFSLGPSPIRGDVRVAPEELASVIRSVRQPSPAQGGANA